MNIQLLDLLACPDCRGDLELFDFGSPDARLLACHGCEILFPIADGIPVLLPRNARSRELEQCTLEASSKLDTQESPEWLGRYMTQTVELLPRSQGKESWEWEDEEYWSEEYERQSAEDYDKNWNDRIWQREFLLDRLTAESSLQGKTILDVGCGQGQNFRQLLHPHCDDESVYIAADVSMAGLRLNRRRNPHGRALYILCSADRLPLRTGSVDLLCYFGILHHTERKGATMAEDSRLLRAGGHMVVHEALDRPHLTPEFLKRNIVESAHEERIPREEFLGHVRSLTEMHVVCSRQTHTILLGGMMKLLRWPMIHSKTFFSAVSALDVLSRRALGEVVPFFCPGEVLMLLRKSH